jgi:hypothetical protein
VSRLTDIGDADNWRCWICDEPVDANISVNDGRGPSVDSCITKAKSKKVATPPTERLAHRQCNTMKGANAAVIAWPEDIFVVDPSPILASVDRLQNKGGREAMARCMTRPDAVKAADWLVDRISRLRPELSVTTVIEPGGGQFLVVLKA